MRLPSCVRARPGAPPLPPPSGPAAGRGRHVRTAPAARLGHQCPASLLLLVAAYGGPSRAARDRARQPSRSSSLSTTTSRPRASSHRACPCPGPTRACGRASLAHALHDAYTDMIYVLLPVWQAEFGWATARSPPCGASTPGPWRPSRCRAAGWPSVSARTVLVAGTVLAAPRLRVGRPLRRAARPLRRPRAVGRGSEHAASARFRGSVPRLWRDGTRSARHLQLRERLGKAALPALTALLLAIMPWRPALWLLAPPRPVRGGRGPAAWFPPSRSVADGSERRAAPKGREAPLAAAAASACCSPSACSTAACAWAS